MNGLKRRMGKLRENRKGVWRSIGGRWKKCGGVEG